MKYKALIADLDGTIVRNAKEGLPSKRVIETINKASQHIKVGIATARPLDIIEPILDRLTLSGPCVINGGAQIIDPISKKIYYERSLLHEDIKQICSIALSQNVQPIINDGKDKAYTGEIENGRKVFEVWFDGMTEKQADELITALSHIATISLTKAISDVPEAFSVSTLHPEATKQHSILEIAKILDITTHDIIGIGDGPNDFPLLMACGFKVAMGNAGEDLKAIADYIAPSVEEDGVADVIEKFIL